MKTYSQLLESINEMFPGSKEYIAKFGKAPLSQAMKDNKRSEEGGVVHKGTYGSGEDRPEPKDVETAPKRGRGRPSGTYGSYKTNPENKGKYKGIHAARKAKLKEALEIIALLDESKVQGFINLLDEDTFADVRGYIALDEAVSVDDYFSLVEADQLANRQAIFSKSRYGQRKEDVGVNESHIDTFASFITEHKGN